MDFRRIELIFLVVFVSLDIFLFSSYKQFQNVIVDGNKSSASSISYEMKSANISTGKLSDKAKRGYYLAGKPSSKLKENISDLKDQDVDIDGDTVVSHLKKPIEVDGKDVNDELNRFIEKPNNVFKGYSYNYNKEFSNDKEYIFSQTTPYGELVGSDSQITFTKKNSNIFMYKQTNIQKMYVLREEQNAISEKDAVDRLYTASEIPDNSKIMWTKFAYNRLLTFKGSSIYVPAWFVQIKNKSAGTKTVKIINGFNGTIMKNR